MPQAKATVRRNRKRRSAPMLSAAGLSLSLAAGPAIASNTSPSATHTGSGALNHELLHEEEITDLSLATFHIFEKNTLSRSGVRLGGGCGACGGSFYLPPVFGLPTESPGRQSEPYAGRQRRQFRDEDDAPRSSHTPKNTQVPKSAQTPKRPQGPKGNYQSVSRPAETKPEAVTKNPPQENRPIQQTQPAQEPQQAQQTQSIPQVPQVQRAEPTEPALGGQANQSAGEQIQSEAINPTTSAPN
jgi:hypothetical protein